MSNFGVIDRFSGRRGGGNEFRVWVRIGRGSNGFRRFGGYLKGQKNDFRDAEATAETVQRPRLRFGEVPIVTPGGAGGG